MYVIIAYDVNVERVSKINKFLKRFLHWIQNSVFEGELTNRQLEKVKRGIEAIIKKDVDCVKIYTLPTKRYLEAITIGIKKSDTDMIL